LLASSLDPFIPNQPMHWIAPSEKDTDNAAEQTSAFRSDL